MVIEFTSGAPHWISRIAGIIFSGMTDPTKRTPNDWLADLELSEAEADAGLTVPLGPALDRIRESIERLEAKARLQARREAKR
jgi:hypothetical protein